MNRKKSRELIMKLLFEMSINREDFRSVLANLEDNLEKKLRAKKLMVPRKFTVKILTN